VATDENNVEVENVEIDPGSVRVRVDLEVRGKEVPVFVQCSCDNVAEGHIVVGQPQANPANVIIDGDQALLDQVPYIYTTPVDTSGLDETTVLQDVPLDLQSLPEGVTVDPTTVDVSIRIEQTLFTQTVENVPIEVIGAPENTRVVVNPATLNVEVSGPRSQLDQLQERDVAIVVDVTGLEVGAHQVRPKVVLPAGLTYTEELPQVVVAIIDTSQPPLPTARPTPTPEPTPVPTQNP
jgi:YbbR domain-containing protein